MVVDAVGGVVGAVAGGYGGWAQHGNACEGLAVLGGQEGVRGWSSWGIMITSIHWEIGSGSSENLSNSLCERSAVYRKVPKFPPVKPTTGPLSSHAVENIHAKLLRGIPQPRVTPSKFFQPLAGVFSFSEKNHNSQPNTDAELRRMRRG